MVMQQYEVLLVLQRRSLSSYNGGGGGIWWAVNLVWEIWRFNLAASSKGPRRPRLGTRPVPRAVPPNIAHHGGGREVAWGSSCRRCEGQCLASSTPPPSAVRLRGARSGPGPWVASPWLPWASLGCGGPPCSPLCVPCVVGWQGGPLGGGGRFSPCRGAPEHRHSPSPGCPATGRAARAHVALVWWARGVRAWGPGTFPFSGAGPVGLLVVAPMGLMGVWGPAVFPPSRSVRCGLVGGRLLPW